MPMNGGAQPDCTNTTAVVCPWCGKEYQGSYEPIVEGLVALLDCFSCKKTFRAEIAIRYTTMKVVKEKDL